MKSDDTLKRTGKLLLINDRMYLRTRGQYSTDSNYFIFFEPLQRVFQQVSILGCVMEANEPACLPVNGFTVLYWPPYKSVQEFWTRWAWQHERLLRIARRAIADADIIWLTLSHAAGPLLYRVARLMGKPLVLEVVDDAVSAVRNTTKYRGWRRLAATALSDWYDNQTRRMVQQSPSLLLGADLVKRYAMNGSASMEFFENLLETSDLTFRPVRPPFLPCRLLYVGRMVSMKGLEVLLVAMRNLQEQGLHCELRLVGEGPLRGTLDNLARQLELMPLPRFLGYVPFGRSISEHYDWADILVLPSLGGEGVPRVLLEAMAHSVCVVASSVCGIPTIVKHGENGILVPPGDAKVLASALSDVWHCRDLRATLLRGGLEFVQSHTRTAQLSAALDFIRVNYAGLLLPEMVP